MHPLHPLLLRQLKRAEFDINIDGENVDPNFVKLLESVSNAYLQADEGRYIVERSLEISSEEMNELRVNLQKERDIMQSVMSEGLCVLDPIFHIKDVNVTGSLMLCCSMSITSGKRFTDIFKLFTLDGGKPREVTTDELMETFSKNEVFHCNRGVLKTCQGIETPVSFSLNPLPFTRQGAFNGCVLVFRDISETIKYEQFMHDALISAEQSNVAKTQFLANMSHEIRTPMNGILGMLQLLMHTQLNEKQDHYVKKGYECASYLLTLLGNILDFTKIESGKVELENIEFDLKDELESFMVLFNVQCKQKKIAFSLTFDKDMPFKLIGDPNRIKQILNNLASNAIKFTSTGGTIAIHFSAVKELDNVFLTCSITDNGIGIPIEAQSKIFNIFSQADESTTRKYGGTGLGLAITKQLVEQMGGEIRVNSVEGQGSTFTVSIKLRQANPAPTAIEKAANSTHKENYASQILVVENDIVNQEVTKDILTLFGCQVNMATSGKSAIHAVQQAKYDLILMDCQMPDMDGFETTEAIRRIESLKASNEKSIIIALTANVLSETKERCLAAGMNDFLEKPLVVSQLSNILHKYLGTHLQS